MIVDDPLARRIEYLLAADVGAFAAGMGSLDPESQAQQLEVDGGFATFTGHELFGNRAQGVGMRGPVDEEQLDRIEQFYEDRGLSPEFEVCPRADSSLLARLAARGYEPLTFRNVYVRALNGIPSPSSAIEVREVTVRDFPSWSALLLDGFGYHDPAARARVARWNEMLFALPGAVLFLALTGGRPVGTANLVLHGPGASLGGAATVPDARHQGVHRVLSLARLRLAAERGCDLAIVTADPGGAAARNMTRIGFELAYTNIRFRRPFLLRA